ncbi:MAG: hypothetical protein PHO29_11975 [Acetobacterium sp.]|nr:hypothetical protein [Acetobacterium sp.]
MKGMLATLNDFFNFKNPKIQNKKNNSTLYKIILFLGFFNLFFFAISMIQSIIITPNMFHSFYLINLFFKAIFYIFFFLFFLKLYREESSTNEYYLGFLNVFAGIIFVFPLFQYLISVIFGYNASIESSANVSIQMQNLEMTFNIILLCVLITICSHLLKKNSMKFIATVVLFVYLVLFVIYNEITFDVGLSTISLLKIYYDLSVSIGYIILGLLLRSKENNLN